MAKPAESGQIAESEEEKGPVRKRLTFKIKVSRRWFLNLDTRHFGLDNSSCWGLSWAEYGVWHYA